MDGMGHLEAVPWNQRGSIKVQRGRHCTTTITTPEMQDRACKALDTRVRAKPTWRSGAQRNLCRGKLRLQLLALSPERSPLVPVNRIHLHDGCVLAQVVEAI